MCIVCTAEFQLYKVEIC